MTVEVAAEVRQALEKMPGREILDFLVRYFMVNVNWYVSACVPYTRMEVGLIFHLPTATGSISFCILHGSWRSIKDGGV